MFRIIIRLKNNNKNDVYAAIPSDGVYVDATVVLPESCPEHIQMESALIRKLIKHVLFHMRDFPHLIISFGEIVSI